MEGRPDLSSSSDVLPLLKHACHSKHVARHMALFPYARRIISKVSAPDLPSLTQNLMFAPVSRPFWNRKGDGTRGDKHSCCATPIVHTATPLGTLSGDVPCSEAQRTHSRSTIRWRSVELDWELFDTPTYSYLKCILYEKLLKSRQSFRITLYIYMLFGT
jgi:hypothetical protein